MFCNVVATRRVHNVCCLHESHVNKIIIIIIIIIFIIIIIIIIIIIFIIIIIIKRFNWQSLPAKIDNLTVLLGTILRSAQYVSLQQSWLSNDSDTSLC